jgi:glycosyltransferase involved in cell wall biosynthesis
VRIAIIAPPWVPVPPPAYGGTEAVIDNLARGLQAAGHDVLLYATGDSTCAVPRAWVLPEAVGTMAARPVTEMRHVLNAYEVVLEWDADVIHDHTLMGPLYGQRFGVPIVTTNHGPFDSELGEVYQAIAPTVGVVAISRRQARGARHTPIAAVIHHGVDVEDFPFGGGEGGYAVCMGRMNADKGIHTACQVAHAAGVPLKIVAKLNEPEEHAYFDQMVAPLLGNGVEFVGEVGGRAKLDIVAGANCLLNPISWAEPFGMVMIEALACGTPVLVTRRGAAPEIVDDGVTGFVRNTAAELVDLFPQVAGLDRAACRQAAAERFSTERMVDDHVTLFAQLVARRRAQRAA